MKQRPDHLPPELRIKVNYLRKFRVQVCNDVPGGYLCFIVASPHVNVGCGTVYTVDTIDKAIEYVEKHYPETAGQLNQQLTLF